MGSEAGPNGRTLMVGLPGADLDGAVERRLRRLRPAGIILFRRNLVDPGATRRLLDACDRVLAGPRLAAVDQEGGRVSRLEPWLGATPTAARLAAAGPAAVRSFAAATAAAVRALGFTMDLAPVVDLCSPDARNGVGDRSFGIDPRRAAELAGVWLDAQQGAGVAASLKHFPGLGDTDVDSHRTLPVCRRDLATLERLDLEPYRRLVGRAASVLVGHGHYPALDERPGRPATLSAPIVTGLLRERLGYDGLVLSDDMDMGAVAGLDVDGAAAPESLAAGCDLLLYCADLDRAEAAAAAIARRVAADPTFAARVSTAAARIQATARRYPADAACDWTTARDAVRRAADGVA